MLEILVTALLTVHLLLVDVAMAGPLACVWLQWTARRRDDPASDAIARRLAWLCVGALALGGILGALLLAIRYLADDRAYFSALAAIPSDRIWFGLVELLFALACLVAYAALWNRWHARRILHPLLAVAGATNLLVHFPFLFIVVSVLCERRGVRVGALDRAGYRRLLIDGEVLSRVTHVWLAAAAVTGIVIAILATSKANQPLPAEGRRRLLRCGAWLALAAVVMQFPVGAWVAFEMPEAMQSPLLGGDWVASGLFLTALVLALHLLLVLLTIALGDDEPRRVRRSLAVLLIVMLLMVATRVRLAGQAELSSKPAAPGSQPALASG